MTAATELPPAAEYGDLINSFRQMMTGVFGSDAARGALDGRAQEPDAWSAFASTAGLLGLHLPAEYGGQGASFVYSVLAAQAAGSLVLPVPYSATNHVAVPLMQVAAADDGFRAELVDVLRGQRIVVATGLGAGLVAGSMPFRADDNGAIRGSAPHVPFGVSADSFLVLAQNPAGAISVVVLDREADGVIIAAHDTVDATRPQARLTLTGASGRLSATPSSEALTGALARATILLAAESVGGARAALQMALDYVEVRHQFGRPIGSFQALQHLLVNLFAEVETAEALVHWAAMLADQGTPEAVDLTRAASLAKAAASDAYTRVSREALHAHGGIGFTWEHDAQLHLKRALNDRGVLGTPNQHRRLVADALDLMWPAPAGPENGSEI